MDHAYLLYEYDKDREDVTWIVLDGADKDIENIDCHSIKA